MARRDNRKDGFYESIGGTIGMNTGVRNDVLATKRTLSLALGLTGLALGISHLIPALAPNHHVWGLFDVNVAHTAIHLFFGIMAIYAAYRLDIARPIWQGAALFFGALAIMGMLVGDGQILGFIENNGHDIWLHILKAVGFGWLGWGAKEAHS